MTKTETLPAELAEALAVFETLMRDHEAQLRRKAETILQRAKNYAAHHSHPTMEGFRRQVATDAEADAARLVQQADRCSARARAAACGKLLFHEWVENSDVDFLNRFGGRRLIALARRVEGSIVSE
jgi:hypothetical protein